MWQTPFETKRNFKKGFLHSLRGGFQLFWKFAGPVWTSFISPELLWILTVVFLGHVCQDIFFKRVTFLPLLFKNIKICLNWLHLNNIEHWDPINYFHGQPRPELSCSEEQQYQNSYCYILQEPSYIEATQVSYIEATQVSTRYLTSTL